MNKLNKNIKTQYNETDLETALNISARASDDLHIATPDLVARLLKSINSKNANSVVQLNRKSKKTICNTIAGP